MGSGRVLPVNTTGCWASPSASGGLGHPYLGAGADNFFPVISPRAVNYITAGNALETLTQGVPWWPSAWDSGFSLQWPGFNPWLGNEIPRAALCGQKQTKNNKAKQNSKP